MNGLRTWSASLVIWLSLAGSAAALVYQPFQAEYQLKAAFVSKFPEFIEWPEAALDGRPTLDICIARPNPFGESLRELLSDTRVSGRPLVVREIAEPRSLSNCQILFVPEQSGPEGRQFVQSASTRPILTIGDRASFLDDGGIIRLRIVGGRVAFDVDLTAANRAGVKLSSQLLRLAQSVRGGQS